MRIVIGNLPDDVTVTSIRKALKQFAGADRIKLVKEGGAPSGMIELEVTRPEAEALARQISRRVYEGKKLRAWVPLMDW